MIMETVVGLQRTPPLGYAIWERSGTEMVLFQASLFGSSGSTVICVSVRHMDRNLIAEPAFSVAVILTCILSAACFRISVSVETFPSSSFWRPEFVRGLIAGSPDHAPMP